MKGPENMNVFWLLIFAVKRPSRGCVSEALTAPSSVRVLLGH